MSPRRSIQGLKARRGGRTGFAGRGFTLIELLVVVAIIALLMSILLPSLSAAREQAKRAKCGANLHSIGQAVASCATENKGYGPVWDDGGVLGNAGLIMLTWIDVLFDLGYLGNDLAGLCPTDRRPDDPARDRGTAWAFNFVDRFGVGEQIKPGVRGSFAINAQMSWNNPRDKFNDAGRQVYAIEGWWTWFGGINAQWLMFRELRGYAPPPTNYPHWEGTMVGWRHGRRFEANTLYLDGHVGLLAPKRPETAQDLLRTVDTVKTFSWLPAEEPNRFDFEPYTVWGGELPDWVNRVPAFTRENGKTISGGQRVPADYPEFLSPNHRTEFRIWRKLPSRPQDRR